MTQSPHVLKATHVNIAQNKNKLLLILYSSKTHGPESPPQQIKITEVDAATRKAKCFFCPFVSTRTYLQLRGGYTDTSEQFYIFGDRAPVKPCHVRNLLKQLLIATGVKD